MYGLVKPTAITATDYELGSWVMLLWIPTLLLLKQPYHEWVGKEQLEKPLVIT